MASSLGLGSLIMLKDFYIEQISYQQAMQMVIDNHYLHRKAPCSLAFGLFHKDDLHYLNLTENKIRHKKGTKQSRHDQWFLLQF